LTSSLILASVHLTNLEAGPFLYGSSFLAKALVSDLKAATAWEKNEERKRKEMYFSPSCHKKNAGLRQSTKRTQLKLIDLLLYRSLTEICCCKLVFCNCFSSIGKFQRKAKKPAIISNKLVDTCCCSKSVPSPMQLSYFRELLY